ncbi:MAG: flavin reductase family protein, partial [Bradyrhizobiaceae bacterium]|nr:flavin reductase family protein [Bradyrhizobiaceae bacterium]
MTPMTGGVYFDLAKLEPRERYKLLIGLVVPRPIALVTTVSRAGVVNTAPYSFFNMFSENPAVVVIGIDARPD